MEGHYMKNRYQSLNFLQDIILFFINCLLSFPKHVKIIFLYLLYSNDDHKSTFVYPSFKAVNTTLSCIIDLDEIPSFKSCDDYIQFDKPQEIKANISPFVHSLISSKIPDRCGPLKLPLILHDSPPKHYKYLPMFDGELEKFSAQNNIQAFEYSIDIFEIEYDDVFLRTFSQSLQGNSKEWFKHLQPKSISSWEELKENFMKFWGVLALCKFCPADRQTTEVTISTNFRLDSDPSNQRGLSRENNHLGYSKRFGNACTEVRFCHTLKFKSGGMK
jgi:hypothetical protein